jgi:hypothetical protein
LQVKVAAILKLQKVAKLQMPITDCFGMGIAATLMLQTKVALQLVPFRGLSCNFTNVETVLWPTVQPILGINANFPPEGILSNTPDLPPTGQAYGLLLSFSTYLLSVKGCV